MRINLPRVFFSGRLLVEFFEKYTHVYAQNNAAELPTRSEKSNNNNENKKKKNCEMKCKSKFLFWV